MKSEITQEQKNKLEKMANNMDKMAIHANLPIVDELSEVNEHLEGIHENLKMMAEKPMPEMPKMEMPEKHKVEIMGAELVTIKGEQGIQGEKGEQGIQGNDGKNGEKGDKGERGDRGEMGIEGLQGEKGNDGVNGENGKDGSPDTPEQIREKLESLEEENRLDKSAIKGLSDIIKGLDERISNIPRGRGGSRKVVYTKKHNLSDQLDGLTKTFTLPNDTIEVLGVFSSQFPVNFNADVDWTFSGRTLTLSANMPAPDEGQVLWVLITTMFYG